MTVESYEITDPRLVGVAPLRAVFGLAPRDEDRGDGEGGWPGVSRHLHDVRPEQDVAELERLASPRGAGPVCLGIDVHPTFQAGLNVASLPGQGYTFFSCKITEGTGWFRAGYFGFEAAALQAGLLFNAYHFLRSESTGAAQAQWVRSCMGSSWGRIPVMMDWETSVSGTLAPISTANAFINEVVRLGGRVGLDYCPRWFWSALGSPSLATGSVGTVGIITSSYGTNPVAPAYPGDTSTRWAGYGGRTPVVLQYGSRERVAGYSGDLDVNAYRGTRAQLSAQHFFYDPTPNTQEDDVSFADNLTPLGDLAPFFPDDINVTAKTQWSADYALKLAVLYGASARVAAQNVGGQVAQLRTALGTIASGVASIDGLDDQTRADIAGVKTELDRVEAALADGTAITLTEAQLAQLAERIGVDRASLVAAAKQAMREGTGTP